MTKSMVMLPNSRKQHLGYSKTYLRIKVMLMYKQFKMLLYRRLPMRKRKELFVLYSTLN